MGMSENDANHSYKYGIAFLPKPRHLQLAITNRTNLTNTNTDPHRSTLAHTKWEQHHQAALQTTCGKNLSKELRPGSGCQEKNHLHHLVACQTNASPMECQTACTATTNRSPCSKALLTTRQQNKIQPYIPTHHLWGHLRNMRTLPG